MSHIPFSSYYEVDLLSEITHKQADYVELAKVIDGLDKDDVMVLKMHNYGGSVASLQVLVNAMDRSKGHIIADVIGGSYSAGAVITCHAKEIKMGPNSYLMFHNARSSAGIIPPGDQRSSINKAMDACVAQGILTQAQIDELNTAHEDLEIYYPDSGYRKPSPLAGSLLK